MFRRLGIALRHALARYFVAGVLAFAPIGITIWAIFWIIGRLDNLVLPHILRLLTPGDVDPPELPVVGALVTLVVIIILGVFVRHLFGHELVRASERLLRRVPVARAIYVAVKQLTEAIFQPGKSSQFRRVVLIEYPRKGLYAIAFTTGPAQGIVQTKTPERMINCFVPTTPNPTSGFLLFFPRSEVIELDMSVEDAAKLVISAGLVYPEDNGADQVPLVHLTEKTARDLRR